MVTSPCINICKMDSASGLCLGCLRTIDEITLWSRADDSTRINILAAVARRREHGNGAGAYRKAHDEYQGYGRR